MHATGTRIRNAVTAAIFFVAMMAMPSLASADPITLMWNANPASELVTGYKVYIGTQPGVYTTTIDVGNALSYIWPNAVAGQQYYIAVSAYSAGPVEGPRSTEVSGWSNATPTLTNPGNRTNVAGSAITPLQLVGSDPLGDPLTYTAVGLPPGLTLQLTTGLISGSPTTSGVYTVVATVLDDAVPPLTNSKTFTWTITVPTVPPTVSLTAPANGATFTPGSTVTVSATASDTDGTISSVSFYAGTTLIATDTTSPYSVNWTNVATGTYSLTAVAQDNNFASTTSAARTITVSSVPAGWTAADIGAPAVAGSAQYASGTFTVNGAGVDVWDVSDEFQYVYQAFTGDIEITARVVSLDNTDPYAKAGVMIRQTLAADSVQTSLVITPDNGTNFYRRLTTGAVTQPGSVGTSTAPWWVRLTRIGSTVTGYQSSDGVTWTSVGTQTMATSSMYVGLEVTSHDPAVAATAVFDNVLVRVPTANQPPTASLTAPANGATFTAPATITVSATASDTDGTISSVSFYQGTTLIATDTTSPYSVSWNNVAAGNYSLTAVALDNSGGTTTSAARTITVSAPPGLSIGDRTQAEGNSGTTNFVFTVTLSPASTSSVTVQYATANGTASSGSDYTTTSGTLTFAAGVTSQTISVPVIGDTTTEANETFTVTLSSPAGATVVDGTGTGTITNDDAAPLPTLSVADVTKVEGNSGTSNAVFTVTLSAASASAVTVQYATSNGTATAGSDYTATSGTLTLAAGTTSQTIAVPVAGDTTVEANETFTVTLSNPTNATIAAATATGTITNDDSPAPTVTATPTTVVAGATLTATVANGPANPTDWLGLFPIAATDQSNVGWCYLNGSATAPLTGLASATVTCLSPATAGQYNVRLFANNSFTKLSTSATITVSAPPTLSVTDVSKAEGNSGTSNAVFTVTLSAASASSVTVQYATSNGTAAAGSDYTTTSGTLTLAAGTTSQTIAVPVAGDTTFEADETFTVTLSNPTNATIADGTATGTITNDETPPAPTVTASPTTALMGATLTATVANGPANPSDWLGLFPIAATDQSNVGWCYLNGAATAPTTGLASATVTCLSPATAGQYNVRLFANNSFTKLATSATITVSAPPTLSVTDVIKAEGNSGTSNAVFTVTLSAASASSVTVQYATSNGTAAAGSDYTTTSGTLTFTAGSTSRTIAVPVAGDTTNESDETFTVTLSNPTNATIAGATATGTITNDDTPALPPPPTVTLTPNPATVGATLTATVANGPANANDWLGLFPQGADDHGYLDWCFLNGATTAPATGLANATVTCFTAPAPGQYDVRLFAASSFTKLATSATITVPTQSALSITDVTLAEGNAGTTNFVFTVTLAPVSASAVTVQYATSNGTATAGSDYTTTSGTLTFAAGVTSRTITVPVTGDTAVEGNETFNIVLSAPTNATLADTGAVGTITNDDSAPLPTLNIADATNAEGNSGTSNAVFTVTLSAASASTVTVQYATANGTATAGSDYAADSGTVTFAPGTTSQTIAVAIVGDTTVEPNETYTVSLSSPANATIADGSATGTITNDDSAPLPTLSIADVTQAEGNSGTANAVFTVTLSAASSSSVTVQYATANGTATAGSDYTTASGTLTFAAGVTSQTISVAVTGDTTVESDETLNVTLSSPTNATIADGTGIGTVTNDDSAPQPTLSIADATNAEGNSGISNAVFTVTLSAASASTVTVQYATANGTATAGSDYATESGTLTFAPGTTSQTIAVAIVGDTTVEPNETYTVSLSSPTNATIADGNATGTITNDDSAALPTLSIADVTQAEGNSGTTNAVFTVTLSAASSSSVTVQYATANGTATAGSDYTAASGTLTFAPGVTSQTISVVVTGDTAVESDETLNVTLSSPTNATIADGTGIGTITNDDAGSQPSLSISDVTLPEGGSGLTMFVFNVTLSAASSSSVTVQYATANGTATAGSDYTTASGTLTFAPGATSQTVMISVSGDTTVENNETFTVALSSPTNATIADGTGIGTITNDEFLPTLSIADAPKIEGNSGSSNAVLSVMLSAPSSSSVTVQYATANGTATAGTDYTNTSGTLTFAPGVTTLTVAVPILGDTSFEPDETFTVTLSNPGNATILDGTAIGTIVNDDTQPTLSITDVTRAEGNSGTTNAVFTVTLSAASTSSVTVQYATANGTATAGSDYTAASGTLTFAPGATSRTITVPVTGDTTSEGNETFSVNLSSPVNAAIADGTGLGTITNDDAAGLTLTLSPDPVSVGSPLSVSVTSGPGNPTDWIGLYAEGTADMGGQIDWCYLNGTKTAPLAGIMTATVNCFTATVPGRYQVRMFASNGWTKLGTSNTITVNGPGIFLTAAGSTLSATVTLGPGNATDWVGLYLKGAPDTPFIDWCFLNSTKTAPATGLTTAVVTCFGKPVTPGQYEVRLFENNGWTKVFTSNWITVP